MIVEARGSRRAFGSGIRRVRDVERRVAELLEVDHVDRAFPVDPEEHGAGGGSLAALDREEGVPRVGCDGEIVDADLSRVRTEHGGDLGVDAGDLRGSFGGRGGGGAELDREDAGGLVVGGEEDAVRAEGERADRLELRSDVGGDGLGERRGGREAEHGE